MKNNLKIAHRGLWDHSHPENSKGAFKKYIKMGFPIELDVHILKDDTLVVFHDDNLKRMTGLDKDIKDCTYDEIKNLRLKGTKETIPLFDEVLDLVQGKVLLDIEIKTDVKSKKICKLIAEKLDNYDGRFLIKSFSPLFISWFRKNRPKFIRGLLLSFPKDNKIKRINNFCLSAFCVKYFCKPNFFAINKKLTNDKRITKYSKKGIKILVWTIRNDKEYMYDGIIFEQGINR